MRAQDFVPGRYYSNGRYGRNWTVRQVLGCDRHGNGEWQIRYKVVAGPDRRQTATCSSSEFRRWAKYEVALNENSWHRMSGVDEETV